MKKFRTMKLARRGVVDRRGALRPGSRIAGGDSNAFTLIEIMVVVGIMGIVLAMGVPSVFKLLSKEGMRKATSDVEDVCRSARNRAIFSGAPADVIFYPLEHRMVVSGGSGGGGAAPERPLASPGVASGAQIADDIMIEMLDINLMEYKDSEWARVRFYPNGTSDEMTLVLRSPKNEWKKVTTEVTTGMTSVDDVLR